MGKTIKKQNTIKNKNPEAYQVIKSKRIVSEDGFKHPVSRAITLHFTNGKKFELNLASGSINKTDLQLGADMFSLALFNPDTNSNAVRKGSRADSFGGMRFDFGALKPKK